MKPIMPPAAHADVPRPRGPAADESCKELLSAIPIGPKRPRYLWLKFAIEWPVALLLFLITAPLVGFLCVLVRLTSPGPGLYRQTRCGLGGRTYSMFKIRTMSVDAEKGTGAVWSGPHDRRVTRIGRLLRDTHLDELPQLWNVVRGDMSLIGPRPERPELVERISRVLPRYKDRMLVRPGLTGFAQIQHAADLSLDHVRRKLMYDLYYVREVSPLLDARISVGTGLYFTGMTFRALGKAAIHRHGKVAEEIGEREISFDENELAEELGLQATGA